MLLWLLFYTPCVQDHDGARKIFTVIIGICTLVYLAHFATANIFRFEHSGRVCAGDINDDPFTYWNSTSSEPRSYAAKLDAFGNTRLQYNAENTLHLVVV